MWEKRGARAVYGSVLVGALAALIGLQYEWQPPFALVWDGLSELILSTTLYILAAGATWGLSAGIAIPGLSKQYRLLPAITATSVTGFLFLGILRLSPETTSLEAIEILAISGALGLCLGVLAGAASGARRDPDADESPEERNARIGVVMAVLVLGCGAFLSLPRDRVEPEAIIVARLQSGESVLEVGHSSYLGERHALVRLRGGGSTNTLVLEPSEWRDLVAIIATAERTKEVKWRTVGSVSETGTPERSRLEVRVADQVRLVATSKRGSTVTYDLERSQFETFNESAALVADAIR